MSVEAKRSKARWMIEEEDPDLVILDLIVEALKRIGHRCRPRDSATAKQNLAKAPIHICEMVDKLGSLAGAPGHNVSTPKVATPASADT